MPLSEFSQRCMDQIFKDWLNSQMLQPMTTLLDHVAKEAGPLIADEFVEHLQGHLLDDAYLKAGHSLALVVQTHVRLFSKLLTRMEGNAQKSGLELRNALETSLAEFQNRQPQILGLQDVIDGDIPF